MASDRVASSVSLRSFFAVRWASGGKLHNSSTSASVAASSSPSATHSVATHHRPAVHGGGATLLALRQRYDVERRTVEDHVATLTLDVDLDMETVKRIRHYSLLRPILPGHQQAAQDLADRRFRDVDDENIVARPLVIGEAR